ncbi:MAG: hypothetical protein JWN47_2257 [Frankiales bacterium]|nr:hypothetical protein [Frankiales bacterium]
MPEHRLQVLDVQDCLSLLQKRHLGRLAFVEEGLPTILPVNYILVDGRVVFRTDSGGKLEAATRDQPMAFEIDGIDVADRSGWSVLVRGHGERVNGPDELALLRTLPLVAWAPGAKAHYVRISAAEVTGRRISARELPSQWWG